MVKDPGFLQFLEGYISKTKAEASYFFELGGNRTFTFIIDMQGADQMPAIAEPLFQIGAKVEFHPVMSLADLKKALQSMG